MTTTKKRRIELIFFEQESIVRRFVMAHCPVCCVSSEVLTPSQAGDLARVDLPRVYEWLAEGLIHGVRTSNGQELVCRNSLFVG